MFPDQELIEKIDKELAQEQEDKLKQFDKFWLEQNGSEPDELTKSLNPVRSLKFLKDMVDKVDNY